MDRVRRGVHGPGVSVFGSPPHASHVFIKVVKFSNSVMVPQQYEIKISKK